MTAYQCIIVDDEPPARDLIGKYIDSIASLEIKGSYSSAVEAFEIIHSTPIDLVFLDIQMPVLNGIDFLRTLQNPPAVILTTAYREYALDGYDLDIVDYLLKPITFPRFLKSVERFIQRRKDFSPLVVKDDKPSTRPTIFFNVNKTHHKIYLDEITYLESLKDYVRIHTVHDYLVVKGNLGMIMERLPKQHFQRVHRSFAIAIPFVEAYNQSEIFIRDQTIPIGSKYRKTVQSILSNLSI